MKCRLLQYGDVASNEIINSNGFKAKLTCGSLNPVVAMEDTISRQLKKRFEQLQDHFQVPTLYTFRILQNYIPITLM